MKRISVRRLLLAGFLAWTTIALAADYTMQSGDTLIGLSESRYNDGSYWQALKYYNGIGNVYRIPVGTPINFPDKAVLDQVKGVLADGSLSTAEKQQRIDQLSGGGGGGGGGGVGLAPSGPPNAGTGLVHQYDALNAMAESPLPPMN